MMNENTHILLIIADPVLTELISEFLISYEYKVTAVHDGDSGWEEYLRLNPDVIISDIFHNGMNGIEFVKGVRIEDSETPIITLSGGNADLMKTESLKVGANAYYPMPFKLEELKNCIDKLFLKETIHIPSANEIAKGLANIVVKWCTPEKILGTRMRLIIPTNASNFESELFYLYFFLVLASVEIAYRDADEFGLELAKSFIEHIKDAIAVDNALWFDISSKTMHERFTEYFEILKDGVDEMTRIVPFRFLISNSVCPSQTNDDMKAVGLSLMLMEKWIGLMFKQLLASHKNAKIHLNNIL